MNRVQISRQQFMCVVGLFASISNILFLPAGMAEAAGPDAWMPVLIGAGVGALPIALMLGRLVKYHPNKSFTEMAEVALGRWGGRLVGLLLAVLALFIASFTIRDIMDYGLLAMLPGTPQWLFGLLFALASWYAAVAGPEVIARYSALCALVIVTTFSFAILGLTEDLNFQHLRPPLGIGLLSILRGAYPSIAWFSEIWLLGQFLGTVPAKERPGRGLLWGIALAVLILSTSVLLCLLVFGWHLTAKMIFPLHYLFQMVSFGEFLRRLEIILVVVFLIGISVKSASCLWCATDALTRVFGFKSRPWHSLVLALLALLLTLVWKGEAPLVVFSTKVWPAIALPLGFIVPFAVLVGSWWRHRLQRELAG